MNDIKVLAFDVFGTVVDWHTCVAREIEVLCNGQVDGDAFALAWRGGYVPAMQKVMSGDLGWTLIDDLHRGILDGLLQTFKVTHLSSAQIGHLNKVWHRLTPWPDTLEGLQRLKTRFTICTLSNGNLGLQANMSKSAGLPWDCILSAEVFKRYKPDPATYLGVAGIFDVAPAQVLMVAAHQNDLVSAKACGLKTAYIERLLEFGPTRTKDVSDTGLNDFHAKSLVALAVALGA